MCTAIFRSRLAMSYRSNQVTLEHATSARQMRRSFDRVRSLVIKYRASLKDTLESAHYAFGRSQQITDLPGIAG